MKLLFLFCLFSIGLLGLAQEGKINKIITKTNGITLPASLLRDLNLPIVNRISFEDLANSSLENLELARLKELITHLSNIYIKIKIIDENGKKIIVNNCCKKDNKCRNKTDLLTGLILNMLLNKKMDMLLPIFSLGNTKYFKFFKRDDRFLIDKNLIISCVDFLIKNEIESNDIIIAISGLIKNYMRYQLNNNQSMYKTFLQSLVDSINQKREYIDLSSKQKGIILGSILAGAIGCISAIEDKQKKRLWIVDSLTNLGWAATSFIGALPVASTVASITTGIFSMGAVILDIIYNRMAIGDFHGAIKEIEGQIELFFLDGAGSDVERRLSALEILSWMRTTIHLSGLDD